MERGADAVGIVLLRASRVPLELPANPPCSRYINAKFGGRWNFECEEWKCCRRNEWKMPPRYERKITPQHASSAVASGVERGSLARHAGQVPLVRHAQGDEIRAIDAKLVGDAVNLAFFGRRNRRVRR